jgi:hypothetical protein
MKAKNLLFSGARVISRPLLCLLTCFLFACDDGGKHRHVGPEDGGETSVDAGSESAHDAGQPDAGDEPEKPKVYGPLTVDTKAKDQNLDLFGVPGHHIWLEVSKKQLEAINGGAGEPNPGPWPGDGPFFDERPMDEPPIDEGDLTPPALDGGPTGADGGMVEPGQEDAGQPTPEEDAGALPPWPNDGDNPYSPGGNKTHVDHLVIQDAKTSSVADYGKVEVKLVGESTRRPWDERNIPNLRFDTDEFKKGRLVGGFEHFRLNNSEVGSIFRELIAHRIYRALGYPALRASYAFLGSSVWGEDTWIPMTLIEVYKKRFCEDNKELLGGTCKNIWEFAGDAGTMSMGQDACQISTCDNTRLDALSAALNQAPYGEGFKEAMSGIIDWPRFHQFQCMSWIMWTGDDALHNSNNNLILERDDGKLVWAPYSVDISAGQSWYQNTPLYGSSTLAQRCQADPTCWHDTVATCEDMIAKFDALNPELILDDVHKTLTKLGMIRDHDDERAAWIRQWFVIRQQKLAKELERFREQPGDDGCPISEDMCPDGLCGKPEDCAGRCPEWQQWCEAAQGCIDRNGFCPKCEGDKLYYCGVNGTCELDFEACSAQCGEGFTYCPSLRSCIGLNDFCGPFGGDGDGDGPIPID